MNNDYIKMPIEQVIINTPDSQLKQSNINNILLTKFVNLALSAFGVETNTIIKTFRLKIKQITNKVITLKIQKGIAIVDSTLLMTTKDEEISIDLTTSPIDIDRIIVVINYTMPDTKTETSFKIKTFGVNSSIPTDNVFSDIGEVFDINDNRLIIGHYKIEHTTSDITHITEDFDTSTVTPLVIMNKSYILYNVFHQLKKYEQFLIDDVNDNNMKYRKNLFNIDNLLVDQNIPKHFYYANIINP